MSSLELEECQTGECECLVWGNRVSLYPWLVWNIRRASWNSRAICLPLPLGCWDSSESSSWSCVRPCCIGHRSVVPSIQSFTRSRKATVISLKFTLSILDLTHPKSIIMVWESKSVISRSPSLSKNVLRGYVLHVMVHEYMGKLSRVGILGIGNLFD